MKAKRLPLVGCQALNEFPPAGPAEEPLARPIVSGRRRCCNITGVHFIKFRRSVVRTGAQVIPSVERFIITRLHYPSPGRASRAVVEVRLPKEMQEEFLDKILGLGRVMQNSLSDAVDQPGIATEQKAQGFLVVRAHPG